MRTLLFLFFVSFQLVASEPIYEFYPHKIKEGQWISTVLMSRGLSPLHGQNGWIRKVLKKNELSYKKAMNLEIGTIVLLPKRIEDTAVTPPQNIKKAMKPKVVKTKPTAPKKLEDTVALGQAAPERAQLNTVDTDAKSEKASPKKYNDDLTLVFGKKELETPVRYGRAIDLSIGFHQKGTNIGENIETDRSFNPFLKAFYRENTVEVLPSFHAFSLKAEFLYQRDQNVKNQVERLSYSPNIELGGALYSNLYRIFDISFNASIQRHAVTEFTSGEYALRKDLIFWAGIGLYKEFPVENIEVVIAGGIDKLLLSDASSSNKSTDDLEGERYQIGIKAIHRPYFVALDYYLYDYGSTAINQLTHQYGLSAGMRF
jgi:hypothetical protein